MRRRKTHEEYVLEVPNDYIVLGTYSLSKTPILHKHLICGHEWFTSPNNMLKGHKCPKCSIKIIADYKRKSHKQYETEVPAGYKVLDTYINDRTPIRHLHEECGTLWLVCPSNLLQGQRCPECAGKTANIVYLVYFPNLELFKVGITNNIDNRLKAFGQKCDLFWTEKFKTNAEARQRESNLLKRVTLFNSMSLRSGNTETFIDDKRSFR